MADEPSRAQAETAEAATSEQPTRQTQTESQPTPDQILEGDNVEAIKALMRQDDNANALVRRGEDDPWSGFDDDNTQAGQQPAADPDPQTEAPPGEQPGEAETGEAAPGEAEQEQQQTEGEQQQQTEQPKGKVEKEPQRVRIKQFSEADQAIIKRMVEKPGLNIEQAKSELVAEGKLPKPAVQATQQQQTQAAPKDPDAEGITAQEAKIAELEKGMRDAAKAFDAEKSAELAIEHARAVRDLTKLEQRADTARAQQQQTAAQRHTETVSTSEHAAIDLFPDAAKPGTELHSAISVLMAAAPPEAFRDPSYPLTFAARAAAQIGYKPPAAAKKAPPVVPKTPARPVPPKPASGSAAPAGGGKTKGPTLEQQMNEAEAKGDTEALRALLREHGTRSLD